MFQFSRIWLFATPWTAALQASLSITNFQSLLKLMSIQLVMPSNHLILFVPFSSCLQSFPTSGSFPVSQFFTSCGQNIGASAKTLRQGPTSNVWETEIICEVSVSWALAKVGCEKFREGRLEFSRKLQNVLEYVFCCRAACEILVP